MNTYTVFLPNEFDGLANVINEISARKDQSSSATIRDLLCKAVNFEPVRFRQVKVEIKNRRKNRSRIV
jgi:hypothetical protein